jgi:hypothetical protein
MKINIPSPQEILNIVGIFSSGTVGWIDNDGKSKVQLKKTGIFCSYSCQLVPKNNNIDPNIIIQSLLIYLKPGCPQSFIDAIRICVPKGNYIDNLEDLIEELLKHKAKNKAITAYEIELLTTLLGGSSIAKLRIDGTWVGRLLSGDKTTLKYYYNSNAEEIVLKRWRNTNKEEKYRPTTDDMIHWMIDSMCFFSDREKVEYEILNWFKNDKNTQPALESIECQSVKVWVLNSMYELKKMIN